MSPTTTVELELPAHVLSNQREPLQRAMIRHLLYDERITMPEALERLSREDQVWLVETLIQDTEKNLALAAKLTDPTMQQQYWQQCNDLLGLLFHWHEHWTPYHNELLATLRMVFRRYSPDGLTPRQFKLVSTLTRRLHEELLYREDIFSATQALNDVGLDTLLNLSSSSDFLFNSYLEELGRA